MVVVCQVNVKYVDSLMLQERKDVGKRFKLYKVTSCFNLLRKKLSLSNISTANPFFQARNTKRSKNVEWWDSTQHEKGDAVVLELPMPECCRVQLNAMSKVRVINANKCIIICVFMVLVLNKGKRQGKMKIRGFDVTG